jgi:hypothetical protein
MKPRAVPACPICLGTLWMCENHPTKPYSDTLKGGCMCGAGQPCKCNPLAQPTPGFEIELDERPLNN